MSSETPLLVVFSRGAQDTGEKSEAGMPIFESCVIVTLSRPPLLKVIRPATEEDFEQFDDAYKAFLKTEHARSPDVQGYPLSMWPVIDAATLDILAGHDVFTVEKLATLNKRKDLPGNLQELAERAAKMIKMQAESGKYEEMILDRDRRIEALLEEVSSLKADLTRANRALGKLKEAVSE